jgi:hypothetical protein
LPAGHGAGRVHAASGVGLASGFDAYQIAAPRRGFSRSKLMRSLVYVALANRSNVPVDGMLRLLSRRATKACVVPIASATYSGVRSASPRALINDLASARHAFFGMSHKANLTIRRMS